MGAADAPPTATETETVGPGPSQRPTGVTILAILAVLEGIVLVLGGLGLAAMGGGAVPVPGTSGLPAAVLGAFGGVLALVGLLYLVVGWGFWNGAGWSWTAGLILAILGLLAFPIGTIISIIILYYLTRDRVKRYFGRGQAKAGAT